MPGGADCIGVVYAAGGGDRLQSSGSIDGAGDVGGVPDGDLFSPDGAVQGALVAVVPGGLSGAGGGDAVYRLPVCAAISGRVR